MRALLPAALLPRTTPTYRTLPNPLRSHPVARFSVSARVCAARVYQPVRSPTELDTLLLETASSRTPLLTLWTASWCPSCRTALPFVQNAVEASDVQVAFVEVETDAPGNEELAQRYMITSIPTLLAFSRQEAQMETRVVSTTNIMDPAFLRAWIETEAKRRGDGGAGGKGPLGKLFDTFGKS